MAAPKRPHYFNSQFLVVRDFQEEQTYHEELLRRHNRLMHGWGVVHGLEVKRAADNVSFVVEPGSAIDSEGHEIILDAQRTLSPTEIQTARQAAGANQPIVVTIAFQEDDSKAQEDQYPGGGHNVTRKVQLPLIVATKSAPEDGKVIILARISANNDINNLVRRPTSSIIARGSNLGDISLDGTLSFTLKAPNPTYLQLGLDYDPTGSELRIRAWSQTPGVLDTTHLRIKRETGNVVIGTPTRTPPLGAKLEVHGTLKLSANPAPENDNLAAYFWNQDKIGPTIAGFGFEVRTGGNTPRFRVSSTGNVGIGTAGSATTRLEVVSSNSALPATTGDKQSLGQIVRLKNDGISGLDIGGAGDKGSWLQSTNSADLSKNYPLLLNPNGGNVGIGVTDAPQHKLELIGALKLGGTPHVTPDHTAAYFWNQERVGPTIGGFGFEVRTGSDTARFKINSAGNTGFFGNVGIGIATMDPATRLHIVGSGSAVPALSGEHQSTGHVARLRGTTSAGTANPVLDIGSAGDKGFWLQSTDPADLTKNYPLLLNPNGGNVGIGTNLSIGGSVGINGSVGIGTSELLSQLHIRKDDAGKLGPTLTLMNGLGGNGAKVHIDLYTYWVTGRTNPEGRIICEDNNQGTGNLIFQTKKKNAEDMVERLKIDSSTGEVKVAGSISCGGKIGIKSAKWDNQWISARGPTESYNVLTHNKLDEYEEFTIVMSCSREFKENISDLTAIEAMTTLQNLTPVKYDYKGDKAFRQNLGFIAEDMPDNLASHDRKTISPFEVVPVLTRVAKEQQRIIAELQERVRKLQDAVLR